MKILLLALALTFSSIATAESTYGYDNTTLSSPLSQPVCTTDCNQFGCTTKCS